jgi:hypothetical protein
MKLFGLTPPEPEAPAKPAPVVVDEGIDWVPLIAEARRKLLAQSDANRETFRAAHNEDKANFKMIVARAGPFLTVSIERPHPRALIERLIQRDEEHPGRIGMWGDDPDSGAETQTLNTGATRAIVVRKGREPDSGVSATIKCGRDGDRHSSWGHSNGEHGTILKPGDGDPRASAYYDERLFAYRRFMEMAKPKSSERYYAGGYSDGPGKHEGPIRPTETVTGLARAAKDDEVIFTGINMAIHVPAGMGEAVRDQILEAMKA